MSVMCRYSAAVFDDNHVAVAMIPSDKFDGSFTASAYRISPFGFDIETRVKLGATGEWIATVSEPAPYRGRRSHRGTLFELRLDRTFEILLVGIRSIWKCWYCY